MFLVEDILSDRTNHTHINQYRHLRDITVSMALWIYEINVIAHLQLIMQLLLKQCE